MFKELTIDQFIEKLSSDSPVPGGGSAAALAGATAAGLIAMVASLTAGKAGYEEHWDEMTVIRQEMEQARDFFLNAMDEDAGSYAKVIDCFKMPKDTDEEKACRLQAIQDSLYGAAVIPLQIAEKAAELFRFAEIVIEKGNKNAASDGAVAALMARTTVRGALYNVRINASSLKDPESKAELLKKADSLERRCIDAESQVLKQVQL
ncbi:MAG: cyclodeaminase/cyclohydrolase family protein [Clostridiales bacterium]|nr:cyclodeaminase/cyclohydrolase family protein [Clostridiales bacterium]